MISLHRIDICYQPVLTSLVGVVSRYPILDNLYSDLNVPRYSLTVARLTFSRILATEGGVYRKAGDCRLIKNPHQSVRVTIVTNSITIVKGVIIPISNGHTPSGKYRSPAPPCNIWNHHG